MEGHLNKAQKMVRLVDLMMRRGGVSAEEIRGRFDLDARTLRRYLADLRDMGLPVLDQDTGPDRTLALDPQYRRTGVQLSLSEVLSLHFGRKLFTFLDDTPFASDMDDAIERLEPAIPRAHAELAQQLDRKFMAVPEHAKDYRELSDLIDDVVTALIYENVCKADYTKASGSSREYTLEPLTLATYRQGLYLFAKDRRDGVVKSFAVERFTRFSRLRMEKFDPIDFDPEAYVADAFGIISGRPQKVVARFDARVAQYVRERTWHTTQRLDELEDGSLRLELEVGITQELVVWLLGFAGDVTVEEPTSLIERLCETWQKALQRHGQP